MPVQDIHNMLGSCNTGEECPNKGLGTPVADGLGGWAKLVLRAVLFCRAL